MPNNEEWTEERYTELLKTDKDFQRLHDRRIWKGVETALANAEEKSKATKEKADAEAKAKADAAAEIDTREAAMALELERHKFMLEAVKDGIEPEVAEKLTGTFEERLAAIADVKTQERREFLKRNSRQPHVSLSTPTGLYDKLDKLPASELAKVSPGLIDQAGVEMMEAGRKSRGQSLKDELFGGKE